jgi:hypothetical protein
MMHISFSADSKCYAIHWSYGIVCVGCNCCGRIDSSTEARGRARLEYWRDRLRHDEEFNYWFDNPEIRTIQERNNRINLAQAKRQVKYYSQYEVAKP